MTKITDVEASLEQFKSVSLAYQKETSNRFHRMQESIDKNKADADKQFSELLQLLKALQPPTTLPTTIPRFEENSGQCFSSDEVEKEELILTSAVDKGDFTRPILAVKEDLGQKLIDDLDEPLMVLESDGMINKNEFAVVAPVVAVAPIVVAPIAVAPVAPVVVTPVEPSFIPLGRKIKQNQAEQKLGCEICLQERVPAQRRTWDPEITQYDVMEQHLILLNEFAVVAPVVAVAPIVVAPIAVAPFVVAPIAVAPVVVAPVEPSFVPLGRKIKQNQAEQKLGCEICLQEPVPAQRRTWDPGI
ncbi:hypothetical protein Tco_1467498 [Tanacetum coccineum]